MHDQSRGPTKVFRFAGNVLAILAVAIAAFWIIGYLYAFSRWAGFLSLGIALIALYSTAHHWLPWLPGVLVFGVINSLLALITHHAPTNRAVSVSTTLAVFSLAFYALGCAVSFRVEKVSVLDRCAWVVYLAAIFSPVLFCEEHKGRCYVCDCVATVCRDGGNPDFVCQSSNRSPQPMRSAVRRSRKPSLLKHRDYTH